MRTFVMLGLVASTLLAAPAAFAQQTPSAPDGSSTASTPPAASAPIDGGRFRFGINATAGLERVSASGQSVSGTMYGADLRLGYQINDLIAVYAQPHLSFGSLGTSVAGTPVSGSTGTFIGTVMGEVTLIDRVFVGGGFGYGVLNNPSGPTIDLRAGGYPLMSRSDKYARRKGLMLGVDFRSVFVSGATGILVMGAIGYEAF
jgi:hypothetical protein